MSFLQLKRWVASALVLGVASCSSGTEDQTYLGYVEAEYIYVAPPQNGWIVRMPFREGDQVDEGDVLFELDNERERAVLAEAQNRVVQAYAQSADLSRGARPAEIAALEAQLENAKARLVLAETELERTTPLVERGAVAVAVGDRARSDRDQARAQVQAAEDNIRVAKLGGREAALAAAAASADAISATLDQAEWQLDQRSVVAGRPGRVEMIVSRVGEYAMVGRPVLAILPENALKIRFFVPQASLQRVAVGDTIQVATDAEAEPVDAMVSFIATEAEFTPPVIYSTEVRDKLVFAVEARLPDGATLRPGLPVDVRLP